MKNQVKKSGIFRWAVEGLRRLKSTNKFTQSEKMDKSFEVYRMQNDNVIAFIKETMDIVTHRGEDTVVSTRAMHEFYRHWLEENLSGSRAVSQVEFTKRVQNMNIEKSVRTLKSLGGKSATVFLGINPKENYLNEYRSHEFPLRELKEY